MVAGQVVTAQDIRSIRPGNGLAPKHAKELVGRRIKQAIARGTPTAWDLLE